jgi:hypothetical protein
VSWCWAGARRLVAAGLVGLVATIAAGTGSSRAASAAGLAPARPADGAVMIGWHEHGDDVDGLHASEAQLGTRFALVRMYQQWQLPSRRIATMIGEGRLVLVSHKPPTGGWAAVASGTEDPMIRALAAAYRNFGREVLFSFHHEPHDDASDVKGGSSGTGADYLAAWRRIRTIFDAEGASRSAGGNVFFAYSATGSWALKAAAGGPPGSGDPLYPGDDVIDVFAHDRYNWASCRDDGWEEFAAEWAPLVRLAAAHGKPLIAAEFGSPPADGARNDWFRHAADWLRTDTLARRWMWGFAYYHSLHDTCPWDFLNQGDDGRPGWQEAFRDPYFTGMPFSLASLSSGPTSGGAGGSAPAKPLQPVTPAPTTTTTISTTTTAPTTATAPSTGQPPGADVPGGPAESPPAADASGSSPLETATPFASNPTDTEPPGPATDSPGRPARPAAPFAIGLAALLATAAIVRRAITA